MIIMDFYHTEIIDKGNKSLEANLRYRQMIRARADTDMRFRHAIMEACRRDVLYFFNAMCVIHEPRMMRDASGRILPDVLPFLTWPHQDPVIRTIRENIGFRDIGVEKTRAEGMSWIAILIALQDWIFAKKGTRLVNIGFVSRNFDMADTVGDLASLLEKCRWELAHLPTWMAGEYRKDWKSSKGILTNYRNGATISAYSCTGEVGSGGRYTYWIIDELSKFTSEKHADKNALTSTQATTNSRLILGTPYGSTGAYHDVMHEPSSMIKLVLAWEQNPTKNRGLYRFIGTSPVAVDPVNNPLPANYNPPDPSIMDMFSRLRQRGFRLDKGLRSPWYDRECDRADANPYTIAQELDRDYGGSMFKIFTQEFFTEAAATVRQPFSRVDVTYDEMLSPTISHSPDGKLALWMTLDARNKPPDHPYVVGVDIASGLGGSYSSNSVIQIIDMVSMEQVGELATNTIQPDDLADLSVAICYWLHGAYLAWERNPPGGGFSIQVRKIGYSNVYFRTLIFKKQKRKTKEPGWWTDEKTKEVLFSELQRIVSRGELKLRSKQLVDECQNYIRIGRAIEFAGGRQGQVRSDQNNPDAGPTHGDRVMALGVAVQAMGDRVVKTQGRLSPVEEIQPGSIEERDKAYFESLNRPVDDWDDRSNWDIMQGMRGVGVI